MRGFFTIGAAVSLSWAVKLMAGSSFDISPSVVYDLSPSYQAVGLTVSSIGVASAIGATSNNSGDGGTSVRLGGIGLINDGEMAGVEMSLTGSGVLAFDWMVSSEADYDWLSFYEVGCAVTNRISGTGAGWSRVCVTINGAPGDCHVLRWEYEKDPVGDWVGEDCGWIDAASWSPIFTLTVNGGAGGGAYTNGAAVTLFAAEALANYVFDHWSGDTNGVADIHVAHTTLIMPANSVVLTATYRRNVFALTVQSGAGSGNVTNGLTVTIVADAPPAHNVFDRWTGDTNGVADVYAATTTLLMPATDTVVTATYKPILYSLSVAHGSGGGAYPYGSAVEIRATNYGGKRFYRWAGDVECVSDSTAATTTVVMADRRCSLSATYRVLLTVNSGSGGGWYPEGAHAQVRADPDPLWKEFAIWTGDAAGLLAEAGARVTSLAMPTNPVTLMPTYRDSIARVSGSYGRAYTTFGTGGGMSTDVAAGTPSGTPAVKLGGPGVVPDSGFAAFETLVSGSGTVAFWWRVSSESNSDYLKFMVDGVQIVAISGTKGSWAQVLRRVEGAGATHTLRWEYAKNGALSSSSDCGWVDDIVWTGDMADPAVAPEIVSVSTTNSVMSLRFVGERGIPYLVQTNASLLSRNWGDMQPITPTYLNETNGLHRFEILPGTFESERMLFRVIGR